jgi:glucan 1,4-alpha-glucosidase
MKISTTLLFLLIISTTWAQSVSSPNKNLELNFSIAENGKPQYNISYKSKTVIKNSALGLMLKGNIDLTSGLVNSGATTKTVNETWQPVLGEQKNIINNYNELAVSLKQRGAKPIELIIRFRVYNEGVGFRYEFPKQSNLNYFIVSEEQTKFSLTGNHKTFWIPGDFDSQEYVYNESKISEIDLSKVKIDNGVFLKSITKTNLVQSPLMMKSADNIYMNIFEAAVINYPVMHLDVDTAQLVLTSFLVPNAIGDKAYLQAACNTPWRTIMVSDDARDIVGSKMILNLNEPCALKNTSWIKPVKYVGIWWEMHVGRSSWDYSGEQVGSQQATKVPHGANTANVKRYIDFAAKHKFDGVLVEGWNTGWEDWFGNWKEEVFDFVTPYPDFNVKEITAYAKSKGVKMIMHHETSGSASNYERRLDRAFDFMKKNGYDAVKSGYVGRIIPRGEYHDGQTMVNHYNHVAKRAADYQIMVNSHESSRLTGVSRTYPNYIAAEAARGNEFNAWSDGNPPAHETILPFTRLLGGPMDYTPGIFVIKMNHYNKDKKEQVHTTLVKQLALYVTMYSPLQMAADLPENYEKYPDAFQFIKDVATDWDETRILEAEPGDYLTIARKAKNKNDWFLGAITDENKRSTTIRLNFLEPGKKYKATLYEDAKDADWKANPQAYAIRTLTVDSNTSLQLELAAGGGTAISFSLVK